MAKKRRAKKTKRARRSVRAKTAPKKRFSMVFKNLLLFAALALVSFLLFKVLKNDMFQNLFYLLSIIFAFLTIAFLIVLLVFLILNLIKKRR